MQNDEEIDFDSEERHYHNLSAARLGGQADGLHFERSIRDGGRGSSGTSKRSGFVLSFGPQKKSAVVASTAKKRIEAKKAERLMQFGTDEVHELLSSVHVFLEGTCELRGCCH